MFLCPGGSGTGAVGDQADRGCRAVEGGEFDNGGRRRGRWVAGVPVKAGAGPGKDAVVDGLPAVREAEEGRFRRTHGRGKEDLKHGPVVTRKFSLGFGEAGGDGVGFTCDPLR